MVVTALAPVFVLYDSYFLGPCVFMVVTALTAVFVWYVLPWPLCLFGSFCLDHCVCNDSYCLGPCVCMVVTALVPVFVW
jgi:hypothetical protein